MLFLFDMTCETNSCSLAGSIGQILKLGKNQQAN